MQVARRGKVEEGTSLMYPHMQERLVEVECRSSNSSSTDTISSPKDTLGRDQQGRWGEVSQGI